MILSKCRRLVAPILANVENGAHLVGILLLLCNCIGTPVACLLSSEMLNACLKYAVDLDIGRCHVLQYKSEE